MRIGIDCRLWNQTGVGRYIRNLVVNLAEIDRANDYVLFVRKEDLESVKLCVSNQNWRIVAADIRWHSIEEQIKFSGILDKEKLDLVHFPYFSIPLFYNKPYVLTIHDLIIHHFPTGKASTLFPVFYYLKFYSYKFLMYSAAKKAKKIIAPSISTKEEIIDHLDINSEKVIVTYEAVDEKISGAKKIEDLPKEYFLYVGNAYPHKNLDRLLEAFSQFSKENVNVKLVLVGTNDFFYIRLNKNIKKLQLEDKIIVKSEISDAELSYLYKNALGLVTPALMEGFGLPVLEALKSKCLVICSDIPAFKELSRGSALYFNPYEVSSIKDRLKYAYENHGKEEIKEIIKKGYELSEKFSWKKMASETLKVYESSIGLRQS